MPKVASLAQESRFHSLVWGSVGNHPQGLIIGGMEGGLIQVFNASRVIKGEEDALIFTYVFYMLLFDDFLIYYQICKKRFSMCLGWEKNMSISFIIN